MDRKRLDKKRSLTQKELEYIAEHMSEFDVSDEEDEEPYSAGSSDNYEPGSDSESDSDSDLENGNLPEPISVTDNEVSDTEENLESESQANQTNSCEANRILDWVLPNDNFVPAKTLPLERNCKLDDRITLHLSPLQIFNKFFPHSLYLQIVQYTNQRLDIMNKGRKHKEKLTDKGEIQKLLGCIFIMSYNKLPGIKHYWSGKESLGNRAIEKALSRDRFMTVVSKLYFASPVKPPNPSKSYYTDELLSCLKYTFSKCRQDSVYQSIDESMTKFKGRSSLKQYMPLKPTKRGIKLWLRCDAGSGYIYDMNVYCGKESTIRENQESLTLGERVVKSLASTIKERDVVLCFDRFFTSIHLLETLNFAALGTCISNRKNVPTMKEKLQRGQSTFRCTNSGLCCVKWQDTKEVIVISNCHKPDLTTVSKKTKTGERQPVECPEAIAFYRQKMGGVDRADQLVGLYDHDRKSNKWWKKVFYTCLNMCAVNAWIVYNDLRRETTKTPFLTFLVSLAEEIIAEGIQNTALPPPKRGPPSKKRKIYGAVPLHLPVEGQTRRRCSRCSEEKRQKRTKTICQECNIPLCKDCFMLYHVK